MSLLVFKVHPIKPNIIHALESTCLKLNSFPIDKSSQLVGELTDPTCSLTYLQTLGQKPSVPAASGLASDVALGLPSENP